MADSGEGGQLLEVGEIRKAHGLQGEVVVHFVTNRPERMEAGQRFLVRVGSGEERRERELVITESRPFQHRHLVRFDGVGTREAAEALRGAHLLAPAIEDPEAMFVHDLIGCEVVDVEGRRRGRIVAVEANPASDLLVGESGWLVPLRFVVGREGSTVVVEAPEGLFE